MLVVKTNVGSLGKRAFAQTRGNISHSISKFNPSLKLNSGADNSIYKTSSHMKHSMMKLSKASTRSNRNSGISMVGGSVNTHQAIGAMMSSMLGGGTGGVVGR